MTAATGVCTAGWRSDPPSSPTRGVCPGHREGVTGLGPGGPLCDGLSGRSACDERGHGSQGGVLTRPGAQRQRSRRSPRHGGSGDITAPRGPVGSPIKRQMPPLMLTTVSDSDEEEICLRAEGSPRGHSNKDFLAVAGLGSRMPGQCPLVGPEAQEGSWS